MTWVFSLPSSRESPVDCSVTKRSRHISSDGAPLPFQSSYPEPRLSPQTTTPPSGTTEEKRVIVPAGELSHRSAFASRTGRHETESFPRTSLSVTHTQRTCATSTTDSHVLPQNVYCGGAAKGEKKKSLRCRFSCDTVEEDWSEIHVSCKRTKTHKNLFMRPNGCFSNCFEPF